MKDSKTIEPAFGTTTAFGAFKNTLTGGVVPKNDFHTTKETSKASPFASLGSKSIFASVAPADSSAPASSSKHVGDFKDLAKSTDASSFSNLLSAKHDNDSAVDKLSAESLNAPVEIFTGEENETTIFRGRANLKIYDTVEQTWKQRGVGPFHLNISRGEGNCSARLVMRSTGTLGLLLNAAVFGEMKVQLVQSRTLIIGAILNGRIVSYAIKFESESMAQDAQLYIEQAKDSSQLENLLDQEQVFNELEHFEKQTPVKRSSSSSDHSHSSPPTEDEYGDD